MMCLEVAEGVGNCCVGKTNEKRSWESAEVVHINLAPSQSGWLVFLWV